MSTSRDPLLEDLDARQRVAVTSDANPLAILAPAGSGKTRVLTRRIAWRVREGSAEPQHVLTLTFTRKAAGELIERLGALGVGRVHAGTFHSLALSQLRQRAVEEHHAPPTVLASKARLLGSIVDRGRNGREGRGARVVTADLAAEIEWAKARLVDPDGYVDAARTAGRRPERPLGETADLYRRYEQEKRRRRVLDFDDLLRTCAETIERDPVFAATQRWRFRQVFVDEFQDTTPLQLRLLRAWLGPEPDLCVVGDAAQAIYRFAGADATPLRQFDSHFAGATVLALDRNYRSTPQVVAFSEAVLDADDRARPAVHAARPDGPSPSIRGFADDAAEATAVAQGCWEAFTNGVPYDRIGVLFRTNAQSSLFEAALARRGIPSRVGTSSRFVERPLVQKLLAELREAEKEEAEREEVWREGRGRRFGILLADFATTGATGASDVAEREDSRAAMEAREHRDALLRLGREYLAVEPGGSVAGFSGWLDLATRGALGRNDGGSGSGTAVDLLTFHRAKGLEWSVVFVTGLETGLVPISWATGNADALAEERRLLHVALGRSEGVLHVSWARQRTVGGRATAREPSPWLTLLRERAAASSTLSVDPRAGLAGARDALSRATPPGRSREPRIRRHHAR